MLTNTFTKYIHTHAHTRTRIHTYIYTHIQIHTHTYRHTHRGTLINTYTYIESTSLYYLINYLPILRAEV